MIYRECGASGLKLPVLGIGCWSYGGGAYWGEQSQKDVDEVINAALDAGCNFFDTAEAYNDGASESALGEALKTRRGEAVIGTKIWPANCHPQTLREHCEASLKRLGTDYVDSYTIHWPINYRTMGGLTSGGEAHQNLPTLEAAVRTMEDLQTEGKIRYIGISNFGVGQMDELRRFTDKAVVNQLPYSLLSRAIEPEIVPYCREHGMGLVGYMSLMQGLLTGKFKDADSMPANRTRVRHFRGDRQGSRHGEAGAEKETFEAVAGIRDLARELDMPMHHLAMAWSIANPQLTCTLVGARNVRQLEDNFKAVEVSLDQSTMAELDRITAPLMKKLGPSTDLYEHTDKSRSW
jgi:myo-inositol catabolism protein IolS